MDAVDAVEAMDAVPPLPGGSYYTGSLTPIDDGYYESPSCASPPSHNVGSSTPPSSNRFLSGTFASNTSVSPSLPPSPGDFASPESSQVLSPNQPLSPSRGPEGWPTNLRGSESDAIGNDDDGEDANGG